MEGKKVLIADDEENIRYVVRDMLGQANIVLEAKNGEEAVDITRSQRPDLIKMDIMMPGKSGIELYEHIQKTAPDMVNRVVFITADAMGEDTRDFLLKAKARYLTKPLDTKQLKKDVNRILSQGR